MWRGEQTIYDFFVSLGRTVCEESIDGLRRRRQAGQVERHAAQQRRFVGFHRGPQAFAFEPRQNEAINGIARPCGIAYRRQFRSRRRLISPVSAPARPFIYPAHERGNLLLVERVAGIRWRHAEVRVFGGDALDEYGACGIAGDDDAGLGECAFFGIEAQPRHALLVVRAVTGEAVVRENGPHVAVEIHRLADGLLRGGARQKMAGGDSRREKD